MVWKIPSGSYIHVNIVSLDPLATIIEKWWEVKFTAYNAQCMYSAIACECKMTCENPVWAGSSQRKYCINGWCFCPMALTYFSKWAHIRLVFSDSQFDCRLIVKYCATLSSVIVGYRTFRPMQVRLLPFQSLLLSTYCIFDLVLSRFKLILNNWF